VTEAPLVLRCVDFDATLAAFTAKLGLRVDSIFPADAPAIAVLSGLGVRLRLERVLADGSPAFVPPTGVAPERAQRELVLTRAGADAAWHAGRAGMLYRDLIPTRLGGAFIASHIRIPDGGEVPDYVHHHDVRFQMIFCRAGWVRVVYEDQGPPFVMEAGDCVLQPPGIRHRVLESSVGLEVIEIGSPAVHETLADHALALPTAALRPEREFGGQRFVRHIAATGEWRTDGGFERCDTTIAAATHGLAAVGFLRAGAKPAELDLTHDGEFRFLYLLEGSAALGEHGLRRDDCCVIPRDADSTLQAEPGALMLEVRLPS
jgi:quercetin dioxygenase-like cupin family protein